MALKEKPLTMSEEEIEVWQDKDKNNRKIAKLSFPKGDGSDLNDVDVFYAVAPNRMISTVIADMGRKGDSVAKINDVLLNSCILAGDTALLEYDDGLFNGILVEIANMGEVKKSI